MYLHNAPPSKPIKRGSNGPAYGSNGPAYEMRNAQENVKEREGKRETERRKKWGIKSQKKKKKKKKKKETPHTHTFSNRDPCAMTFRECKILAVPDCEE